MDLVGNVRIVKQPLFIERRSDERPQAERKQMNSIFSTKSARVVRALLKDPYRLWTVSELADVAKISMGQASNVKAWLLEHEQITVQKKNISLTRPRALLEDWRKVYRPPSGERRSYYTTLHGDSLRSALKSALVSANADGNAVCLLCRLRTGWHLTRAIPI